jgi:hypothetical protein
VEVYSRARQAINDSTIRRMRFAYWVTEDTDSHSEYVIPFACPWKQWLHERASMLSVLLFLNLPVLLTGTCK